MINSISDIAQLLLAGESNWTQYGHVTTKTKGDLTLFNYTVKAQIEDRWNFFERVSRGLILNNRTGEVVARPFDRFFNYGQGGRYPADDARITAVWEKMDGSLGIIYHHDGEWRVATRGSFDSDEALWAISYLHKYGMMDFAEPAFTYLVEIINPQNRIIVDYKGDEGLVLLAIRNRESGDYADERVLFAQSMICTFPRPENRITRWFKNEEEIAQSLEKVDHNTEGYVVEYSDGSRFKFKSPAYSDVHRILSHHGLMFNIPTWRVARFMAEEGKVEAIRQAVPADLLVQFNDRVEQIERFVDEMVCDVTAAYEAAPKGDKKEFALWVNENHKKLKRYIFALSGGWKVREMLYKQLGKKRGGLQLPQREEADG